MRRAQEQLEEILQAHAVERRAERVRRIVNTGGKQETQTPQLGQRRAERRNDNRQSLKQARIHELVHGLHVLLALKEEARILPIVDNRRRQAWGERRAAAVRNVTRRAQWWQ